jgi:hypothetical protein
MNIVAFFILSLLLLAGCFAGYAIGALMRLPPELTALIGAPLAVTFWWRWFELRFIKVVFFACPGCGNYLRVGAGAPSPTQCNRCGALLSLSSDHLKLHVMDQHGKLARIYSRHGILFWASYRAENRPADAD